MAAKNVAVAEFCVTESAERSSAVISCFSSGTDIGVFPSLWSFGQVLVTNKFADAHEVEGHGVIVLTRLDIVDRVVVTVVTAVVGTRNTNALGNTRSFSVYITLYCLLLDW